MRLRRRLWCGTGQWLGHTFCRRSQWSARPDSQDRGDLEDLSVTLRQPRKSGRYSCRPVFSRAIKRAALARSGETQRSGRDRYKSLVAVADLSPAREPINRFAGPRPSAEFLHHFRGVSGEFSAALESRTLRSPPPANPLRTQASVLCLSYGTRSAPRTQLLVSHWCPRRGFGYVERSANSAERLSSGEEATRAAS